MRHRNLQNAPASSRETLHKFRDLGLTNLSNSRGVFIDESAEVCESGGVSEVRAEELAVAFSL